MFSLLHCNYFHKKKNCLTFSTFFLFEFRHITVKVIFEILQISLLCLIPDPFPIAFFRINFSSIIVSQQHAKFTACLLPYFKKTILTV